MSDTTKTYYLRLSADMSRELRHLAVDTGQTMNTAIVTAIRRHLDAVKASETAATEEPKL